VHTVEIVTLQDSVVLRARGSELLILPHHVKELKGKKVPRDFTAYFTDEALINRPARRLFEAWLRNDETLWPRLYKTIHDALETSQEASAKVTKKEIKADAVNDKKASKHHAVAKEAPSKVDVKKADAKKQDAKETETKSAKAKAVPAAKSKPAAKEAAAPKAKTAKPAVKSAAPKKPAAAKPAKAAAKSTAKKPAAKAKKGK